MTDITLEQRALALVNRICQMLEDDGSKEAFKACVREAEAALRLSAGADWVLVPREPTLEMFVAGAAVDDDTCETYRAMIAAAPRHETGEVENG